MSMRIAFAALLAAGASAAQQNPGLQQAAEPFRIEGNLYSVGGSDVTSFLIVTPDGHVLIDGGYAEMAPLVVANVRKLGFRIEDVRFLLNSHAHLDHAGGLAALKKASGATFVASRADAPLLARGGLRDPQFRDRFPFPPIVPDRIVDDGDTVTLGGVELVARITPGHTPGCTTWTTTAGRRSVAFLCSASVPAGYTLTTNRRYPNAVADYRRTFAVLRSLHPDIFLGSHGSFFDLAGKTKGGNFVDPEGYKAFVEGSGRDFEERVASESIVVHDATVIDGTGAPPKPHTDLLIRDGHIAEIADAAAFAHPAHARVVDASGKFVVPGFVDMHAHLLGSAWNEKGELEQRWNRQNTESYFRACLRFGVTTVREPGAVTENAVLVRRLLQDGELDGPALFTAGRILNSSPFSPEPFVVASDEAHVRDEIRWQSEAGVDAIKIYSSVPPVLAAAAIDEAHRRGLPVIGHLQRTTWTEAARLGIDGVEHAAPWSVEYLTANARAGMPNTMFGRVFWLRHLDPAKIDEMIAALVEHHVVVDPTLMATMATKFWGDDPRWRQNPDLRFVPDAVLKGWPAGSFTRDWTPAQYAEARRSWPILLGLIRKMYESGVQMVVGTDTPTPWIVPGASVHDEMKLLADAGIPPLAILSMATSNAARALRREDEFGSIRKGLRADLVVLGRDPLASIANTRSIETVIQNGAVSSGP